jgi:hypothetical protein
MISKKLVSSLIAILFGLNFAMYAIDGGTSNLDNKLSGCLNLIHNYYDENLILTECDGELAKIRRVIAGVFLSSLSIPGEVDSDSVDLELEDKIKEILKSDSPIQKEAAIQFINYMMFYYESEYGADNVYFNLIWQLFEDEWKKKKFFDLCTQPFINQPNVEITVCKAYYDLFCQYIFKAERSVSSDDFNKIIEIGLKKEDLFIQSCVQMLKFYDTKAGGNWNKEDFDFFKKDILVRTQEIFFNKFVLKASRSESDCDELNDISEKIRNGLFSEDMKLDIEKKINKFKSMASFKAFINLCNTAIDSNVGIKNIIEIMGKINLESCSCDYNKELLKVCTKLTKYTDFFDTGLRFMQEYNQAGGLFSYGDEYYHFCSQLICNNLELFCTIEKLKEYVFSDLQNYKMLGSLIEGIILYEEIVSHDLYACKNGYLRLNDLAREIKYIRKNSEPEYDPHKVLWSLLWEHVYSNANPMELIHFKVDEKNINTLCKDSFIFGMLFSKSYICQNAVYNFLDIACILGSLASSGYTAQNTIEFLDRIRNECPMSTQEFFDCLYHNYRYRCKCHDCMAQLEAEKKRRKKIAERSRKDNIANGVVEAVNTNAVCTLCDIDLSKLESDADSDEMYY